MATFIDPQDEELQDAEQEQVNSIPEPTEQTVDNTEEVVNASPPEDVDPEIPNKYKGKTLEEIVKMHQEAEKLIGRQAQEVGEVRKLADELIKRQLESKQTPDAKVAEEDDVDWFAEPEKAVRNAVDKHPAVKEAQETVQRFKQQEFMTQLKTDFPDFQKTVADPEFAQWIQASPVRLRLYAAADNLDFDSAAELLNTWKLVKPAPVEQKPQVQAVSAEIKADRAAAMKAVAVDTGSTGNVSAKIYRRSDLIRLQLEDPQRYMDMQPEIMSAYAEGRVR
jgi:hypothetical protein